MRRRTGRISRNTVAFNIPRQVQTRRHRSRRRRIEFDIHFEVVEEIGSHTSDTAVVPSQCPQRCGDGCKTIVDFQKVHTPRAERREIFILVKKRGVHTGRYPTERRFVGIQPHLPAQTIRIAGTVAHSEICRQQAGETQRKRPEAPPSHSACRRGVPRLSGPRTSNLIRMIFLHLSC